MVPGCFGSLEGRSSRSRAADRSLTRMWLSLSQDATSFEEERRTIIIINIVPARSFVQKRLEDECCPFPLIMTMI